MSAVVSAADMATGSFNGALVFVGANALAAAFAYLVVVGKIERVVLKRSS